MASTGGVVVDGSASDWQDPGRISRPPPACLFLLATLMPNNAPPSPSSRTRLAIRATASGLQPRGSSVSNSSYDVTPPVSVMNATTDSPEWAGLSTLPAMARRGSAQPIFFALLAAAGTGAAQLGLGYGLGIIVWEPRDDAATGAEAAITAAGSWSSALTWATMVAATSVVVGAVVGDRLRGNLAGGSGRFARFAWRLVLALSAAIGAAVVIPLVGVPASRAHVDVTYAPHLLVGVYAAAGVVIGLLVALVAMTARAVAANVFATASWMWALAIVAIAHGSSTGLGRGYAQLGIWKFTDAGPMWHSFYVPGAMLMLAAALLIGGTAPFAAAARGDGGFGVAISGAAGPLLVLAAYLLARPDQAGAPAEQVSAYYTVPYMVLAGLAGSVLVAAVGGGFGRRPVGRGPHVAPSRCSE